jgi:hypothetical protein
MNDTAQLPHPVPLPVGARERAEPFFPSPQRGEGGTHRASDGRVRGTAAGVR